ncbi:hypothetical protein CRUP_013386 [Coryphaenoides rupestris]|nr:hypothetical protein CRUP_013386 [Coryphaenoides rupestris]
MVVTWTTYNSTDSLVEYGRWGGRLFNMTAKGSASIFMDSGSEKRQMYIHRVTLSDLKPGSRYVYHCGSDMGWSDMFWFKPLDATTLQPRFALYGDLGNENPQSLARLQKETQTGVLDAILHIGDFAYDLDEDNARTGDEFMRQIQSIAAYVPYMTCPGNHESAYNFSNYRNRFSMPGQTESLWYSWNVGPAHIISLSTEEANEPANRAARPWIITMGHRPMYCSDDDQDDCTTFDSFLWAHEHTYERLWPVYGDKVFNGSAKDPYTNPKAPVHIITGSAGCKERTDKFNPNPKDWSAFRSSDYGYTRMQVVNGTHIYLEQVSDDRAGEVIDSIWIVKEKHGYDAWL